MSLLITLVDISAVHRTCFKRKMAAEQVEPPFGPPDIQWKKISHPKALKDGISCGKKGDDTVYIGRAYHEGELLIGTAVPSAGICYISKDGEVYEYADYEIVTVPVGDPLIWEDTEGTNLSRNAVKSGKQHDKSILYAGRHQEDGNSYIGWVHPKLGCLYVPQEGAEKVYTNYELLVHKFLDRLCICPPRQIPR